MDRSLSRHANNAGLALPTIPRRSASSGSASRSPARSPPIVQAVLSPVRAPARVVIQPPTPPDVSRRKSPPVASISDASTQLQARPSQEDASSGSGSDTFVEMLAPKVRRARGVHQRSALPSSMRPPEQSTPTPAAKAEKEREMHRVPFPSYGHHETPRASTSTVLAPKPRPGISPLAKTDESIGATNSDQAAPMRSASVNIMGMGRKKSGEPLKSSLKSRRPVVRGDLSVVTGPMSTKSEPSTPTCIKSVHFDSQLEHVKLFLAEQKPLAVSRDGSPTDDTSGTESDFPAFIYGKDEEKGKLEVAVNGLKSEAGAVESELADVRLIGLQLGEDGTSIVGRVRVRNLAFEKWIAVRFTCDNWQTTSEVAAKYAEGFVAPGIEKGKHDVFQFTVRLNDMMSRIEEKTMFLAVRYSTAGKEMWDNNAGENYKITFKRERLERKKAAAGRAPGIADLKSKLEKVAQAGANESKLATVGGFLSSRATRSSPSSPPIRKSAEDDDEDDSLPTQESFTLKSNTPLSSRYDFSASLKSPWRQSLDLTDNSTPIATERVRTRTHPTTVPHFPRRGGPTVTDKRTIVELTRGSPRIFDADESPKPFIPVSSDLEDTPVPAAVAMARKTRNHQRGYFDLGVAPSAMGVKRTPPGSPFGGPAGLPLFGSGSVSPTKGAASAPAETLVAGPGRMWRVPSGGSEESTPSSVSNDDSSRGSSPNTSPYEGPVSLAPEDLFPRSPSPGDSSSYSAFLNRFCFYTGSESMNDFSEMQRSHSASSVEEFLSTSPYLGNDYLSPGQTPTRSSSYDDVATISGNSTPTPRSIAAGCPSVFASPPSGAAAFVH